MRCRLKRPARGKLFGKPCDAEQLFWVKTFSICTEPPLPIDPFSCVFFIWTASSEFGTSSLCEQRRFRRACASAQSYQNLRCLLIQAVSQEEPSDRKPDPWPLWMAGHAQLKFVMTECSKTQIRLTGLIWKLNLNNASFYQFYAKVTRLSGGKLMVRLLSMTLISKHLEKGSLISTPKKMSWCRAQVVLYPVIRLLALVSRAEIPTG